MGLSRSHARLVVGFLLGIALLRVMGTYRTVGQTSDEPAHLAAGIEWLDGARFDYEPKHPPLARVTAAVGPWLDGRHSMGHSDIWLEGSAILEDGPDYRRTLVLARFGILPFFLLAILGTWWWGRRLAGPEGGILAVLLVSTLPTMLAHAGLVTTDMALTGMFVVTTVFAVRWFDHVDGWSSIALGAGLGLSVLAKLSALLFLPIAGVVILASRFLSRDGRSLPRNQPWVRGAAVTALAMVLTIWAGYRFSTGTVADTRDIPAGTRRSAPASTGLAAARIVPAPELLVGIHQLESHATRGHKSFLLGEVRYRGWWYYFPVAIAVKTPIPFLVLSLVGMVVLLRRGPRPWWALVPVIVPVGLVLAVIPSRINIGVRHLLPIFPLLAAVAGAGAVALTRLPSRGAVLGRVAVAALLAWQVAATAKSHPDYLSWFNFLAGSRPDYVLVDSDLDWGQDMNALADTLRARGARSVTLAGGLERTPPSIRTRLGFPPSQTMKPFTWTPGYVAVDLYGLHMGDINNWRVPPDAFAWLENFEPVAMVGKTIRLYHLPDDPDLARPRRNTAPLPAGRDTSP